MSHVRRLPQYALACPGVASWFAHADPQVSVERRHGVSQMRAEASAAAGATLRYDHNRPAK